MAPIAVSSPIPQAITVQVKKISSPYKEQASGPRTYSKENEEKGTKDQPAAKVSAIKAIIGGNPFC